MKVETTEERIAHARVCKHWNISENVCDCYQYHVNRKFGPVGADCEMCPTRKEQAESKSMIKLVRKLFCGTCDSIKRVSNETIEATCDCGGKMK